MQWSRQSFILAVGFGTVLIFAALITYVFGLSSESGSTFGAYSTYRSDPLGMMAVYNALDHIDGYQVERYIKDYETLPPGAGSTLVIAGAAINPDPVPVLDAVESFAATGGRVIIAFYPLHEDSALENLRDFIEERDHPESEKQEEVGTSEKLPDAGTQEVTPTVVPVVAPPPEEDAKKEAAPTSDKSKEDEHPSDKEDESPDDAVDSGPPLQDISERWEFNYGFETPGPSTHFGLLDKSLPVEPQFSGHSGLYLTPVAADRWEIVYGTAASGSDPVRAVMMERKIGSGSVVLCSDAFFLSNEALQKHYDPELLSWLFGGESRVLFSEVHLGTHQQDRVMTLVRRYRLHGVLFGLVLIAALFVWHHAATLVPRQDISPRKGPATVAERSHQDGLDNLLARFIPQNQLLNTCVREWCHQFHHDPKAPAVQRLASASPGPTRGEQAEAELVAAYNTIARELHHK